LGKLACVGANPVRRTLVAWVTIITWWPGETSGLITEAGQMYTDMQFWQTFEHTVYVHIICKYVVQINITVSITIYISL